MRRLFLAIAAALCLAALLPAPRAHATACTGGCTTYFTGSAFSGSTVTVSATSITAGSNLRIWFCGEPNTLTLSGVTVGGNAATLGTSAAGSGNALCGSATYPNAPSGTNSVVVTFTGTCSNCNVIVEQWAGDATSSVLDGSNVAYVALGSAAGQNMACGNITTANANDTIEAIVFQQQGVAPTGPAGYSAAIADTTDGRWSFFETVSATGTYNPTPTSGASSFSQYIICGAFKQAGGGGGPTLPLGSLMLMGVGK